MIWNRNNHQLNRLEDELSYKFKDKMLLYEALTHKSVLQDNPSSSIKTYERLEFLGDAVLEFVISDYYFNKYPNASEGELTELRTRVVNGTTLVLFSNALDLDEYIFVSPSIDKVTDHICEDVFEALLGAIYLDGGLEPVKILLYNFLENTVIDATEIRHPKNQLQEYIQSTKGHGTINYQLKNETGPDNDKTFYVDLVYNHKVLSKGVGKSIKEAETRAAEIALKKVKYERE